MLSGLKRLFKRTPEPNRQLGPSDIDLEAVPNHVAIIMDGNGRWAKQRNMPRIAGHRAGMQMVKEITNVADDIGIKVLTLYAFSTENWKRPTEEVDFLMRLPEEWLKKELATLIARNCQIRILGEVDRLPEHTRRVVVDAEEKTKANTGLILNIALNYGSRLEIINAIKQIAGDVTSGTLSIDDIDEATVDRALLTSGLPDPDLLIRTSGEVRLSNFLLWQSAYTEMWFTDVYWPDFKRENFLEAIRAYQGRGRRFGGLK
ncbi:isoprenyl transferase [Tumebacillus sp. DT12]|uniref:Isoprenyl transferase n=1 Tax=Tumebacillus lacus TaxID=2995335 RepID=A0ABT3WZ10_9BACL|nr:isoprenyl transferase [Tumebacillus lacus]MCX7568551.1 isoprenyl transferase [Tumebacillus lacus]